LELADFINLFALITLNIKAENWAYAQFSAYMGIFVLLKVKK
jgi:hypothetical protein